MADAAGGCLDLTLDPELTVALLDRPREWRVRVVEQVLVDSPTTTLRRRSLQCEPLRPLLESAGADLGGLARSARLVLPVAPVPKGPLLDFDVTGPDGEPVVLLPRAEIAERELGLLRVQAARAGLDLHGGAETVARLVLAFTDSQWQEAHRDLPRYLAQGGGAGLPAEVLRAYLPGWQALSGEAGRTLRPFVERPSPDSAAEHPVLVVPQLLQNGLADGPDAVSLALAAYWRLLQEAVARTAGGDDGVRGAAREFLNTLADYGGHYDLLVAAEVPLDEPFLLKTSYRRPLGLSPLRQRARQAVVVSDAQSNHVSLQVTDPNTRLLKVRVDRADGSRAGRGRGRGLVAATQSPEIRSFYGPDPDRDYRVLLAFRVASLRRLQVVPYGVAFLLLLLALVAWREDLADRDLALLVGPGALAASLLFAREPSALGSRLRVVSSALVLLAVAVLLTVGAVLYLRA